MTMNKRNITLKDIAEHVGVSIRTVSLAVHGQGRMAPDTRKKILKIAHEWNYHPNIMARGLVNQKSYLLGVIIPYISRSFYAEIIAGIEEKCESNFYDLLLKNSGDNLKIETNAVERMLDRKVDGIICYPTSDAYALYKKVIDSKIPLVQISRIVPGLDAPSVMVDGENGIFEAVEMLIKKDRRKIVYIGSGSGTPLMNSRRMGYRKALRQHNLALDLKKYDINSTIDFSGGYNATRKLLDNGLQFDAIVTGSEDIAIGAIKACNEFGKIIPKDISVIGYGDTDIAQTQSQMALTSVCHPKKEIGYVAFDLFIKQLQNKKVESQILKTKLIERDTTS